MAQYDVRHVCGHTVMHQLYGKEIGRTHRRKWLASTPCRSCLEDIDLEQAEAYQERHSLPELVGTLKQVDWALVLRHKTLVMIDRVVRKERFDLDLRIPVPAAVRFADDETVSVAELLTQLRKQDHAKWWIVHCRDVTIAGRDTVRGIPMGFGMLTEFAFVRDVLRDCIAIDRATMQELIDSGDPRLMMRAIQLGR